MRARQTQYLMILPLLSRGQVIGTIGVDTDQPDRVFTPDEVMLAEMIAIQIAGMIENIRLFDEDLRQAYQQLQELDKLKSAFIGLITHELRSPFVAASLSVQLLGRYAENKMFGELQNQVKQLDRELAEGRKMIDNIISFASLMSKKEELHLEETDIAVLTHEAITPLAEMASTRNVTLSFDFHPQLPPVQVDKERMKEVIYHLVYNAVKFNRQGGSVQISGQPAETQLVFKVEDTGSGLSQDKLATIWEAFAQTADDLKRGMEGLGLGLALVRFVVKAHGGEVAATSKPGQGSVFGFRIPFQPHQ